jgi:hypothetical protein
MRRKKGGREGRKEGGKERGKEGGRKRGREGGKEKWPMTCHNGPCSSWSPLCDHCELAPVMCRSEMLHDGVEGPCLHRLENWPMRQLSDL